MRWRLGTVLVLVFVASGCAAAPRDAAWYQGELAQRLQRHDHAAAEELLLEWDRREPRNPDVDVAFAELYFSQASHQPTRVERAEAQEDGAASTAIEWRPSFVTKALGAMQRALALAPERLDIHLKRLFMLEQTGQAGAFLAAARELLGTSGALTWEGRALPRPAAVMLPESLHDYTARYYARGELDQAASVAKLVVARYPSHPVAYNDLAAIYMRRHELSAAMSTLEQAHQRAPTDVVVITNLAHVFLQAGRVADACGVVRKIPAITQDEALVRDARGAMVELGCQ